MTVSLKDILQQLKLCIRQSAWIILLVAASFLYIWIAFHLGVGTEDGGPDENMRSLIPLCMINGNWLPSGFDSCAIYHIGNWSYAFYPQFLGAYLSAAFMSLFKIFGASTSLIYTSGRLASVLCSLISLSCLSKTTELIFINSKNKNIVRLVPIALIGFWPQYAFISSYMNNDIIAFCGVCIMLMSLLRGIRIGWSIHTSLAMAVGVIFSALGYWNAYGFLLAFVITFIVLIIREKTLNRKQKYTQIAVAAGTTAVIVFPFFIINYLRYDDMIGMSIFKQQSLLWQEANNTSLLNPWTTGVRNLLLHSDFVTTTLQSFIGQFGYMSIPIPSFFQALYLFTILLLIGASLPYLISKFLIFHSGSLIISTTVGSLITVALFFFYTLRTDYQPQGRYIMYLLVPIGTLASIAVGNMLSGHEKVGNLITCIFIVAYIIITVYMFTHIGTVHHWNGVHLKM